MPFKFEDFREEVKDALNDAAISFLEEIGMEIESQAKRNSRVKTGQTKGSFGHIVNEDELEVTIGSPLENAIWEELGTGEYALNGDGRKGGWYYYDENGKKHFTYGKKPSRALWNAYQDTKPKIEKKAERKFKELS